MDSSYSWVMTEGTGGDWLGRRMEWIGCMAPVGPETTHDDRSARAAPDLAASDEAARARAMGGRWLLATGDAGVVVLRVVCMCVCVCVLLSRYRVAPSARRLIRRDAADGMAGYGERARLGFVRWVWWR